MKKNIFYITSISLLFLSCNSNQKVDVTPEKESNYENVTLIIEAKILHNDKFQIYYTNKPNIELNGENLLNKFVYGSDEMQTVVFEFPKNEKPYKIRLDLGENEDQTNLTIKNISLRYKDEKINGDEGKFLDYWSANESLFYDSAKFIYNIVPFNNLHDPLLISNINLEKKLLKFKQQ